jgi:hypothetical protein
MTYLVTVIARIAFWTGIIVLLDTWGRRPGARRGRAACGARMVANAKKATPNSNTASKAAVLNAWRVAVAGRIGSARTACVSSKGPSSASFVKHIGPRVHDPRSRRLLPQRDTPSRPASPASHDCRCARHFDPREAGCATLNNVDKVRRFDTGAAANGGTSVCISALSLHAL